MSYCEISQLWRFSLLIPFALHLPFGSTGLKVGNRLRGNGCTLLPILPYHSVHAFLVLLLPIADTTLITFLHNPGNITWSRVASVIKISDLFPSVWPPSTRHLFTNLPRSVDSQPCCFMNSSTCSKLFSYLTSKPPSLALGICVIYDNDQLISTSHTTCLLLYTLLPKSSLQLVVVDIGRAVIWNPCQDKRLYETQLIV